MADYIGSNDDASNLGLYAGIGVVGAVGGAALAYRATSPIYKDDNSRVSSRVSPAPATVGAGEADVPKMGSLANLRKGIADMDIPNKIRKIIPNKDTVKKVLDYPIKDVMQRNLNDVGNQINDAKRTMFKNKQGDMDYIGEMIKNEPNLSAGDITERLYKERPNTLVEPNEVQKRIDRIEAKKPKYMPYDAETSHPKTRNWQQTRGSLADTSKYNVREAGFKAHGKALQDKIEVDNRAFHNREWSQSRSPYSALPAVREANFSSPSSFAKTQARKDANRDWSQTKSPYLATQTVRNANWTAPNKLSDNLDTVVPKISRSEARGGHAPGSRAARLSKQSVAGRVLGFLNKIGGD